MTSIKNNNKLKLVIMCIALYLYLIILGIVWSHYSIKIMINRSSLQNLIIIIFLQVLILLPIIIGTLYSNFKNIRLTIKNSFKFKIVARKVFYTIIFSAAVFFIIPTLNSIANYKNNNFILTILNFIPIFILALPEEILFRWFFQSKLEEIISNKFISTLIAGLLFAILHLSGPTTINSSMNLPIILFLIGRRTACHFIFNFIKEKSDSIVVPAIVHTIYNYLIMYL